MQSTYNDNNYLTIPPVYVYFKEAFTNNRKTYLVYPDWTLNQFRDAMKPIIAIDFGFDAFDLVQTGQPSSENGEPLQQSNDIKLKDLWTSELLMISFYIRRL
jgi:hypothetical protein